MQGQLPRTFQETSRLADNRESEPSTTTVDNNVNVQNKLQMTVQCTDL